MKIAIDARGVNWYRGSGIGTYTEEIIKNLVNAESINRYYIYWSGNGYKDYQKDSTKVIMASKKHHRFFEQYYFPYYTRKECIDIFHVPQNGIGLSEDIRCKKVITIHDLIPYIMPETVGKGYLLKFLKEVPRTIQSSDAIITVSEWSKNDILRFFPIDSSKIFVTPLAADSKYKPLDKEKCRSFLSKNYNIDNPFILYVGGFSPRKNVKALIMAFIKIQSELDKAYNLVIVGAKKDEGTLLSEMSDSLDISSKIIFTGFVPEADLPILYNGCEVFVYPSLYEGFGLPPLEAMSCGTPVITSNSTSIPEVVKDGGILIDPTDISSLTKALGELLSSEPLKEDLRNRGLKRALNFSWEKTAKETLKVYENIYNSL